MWVKFLTIGDLLQELQIRSLEVAGGQVRVQVVSDALPLVGDRIFSLAAGAVIDHNLFFCIEEVGRCSLADQSRGPVLAKKTLALQAEATALLAGCNLSVLKGMFVPS